MGFSDYISNATMWMKKFILRLVAAVWEMMVLAALTVYYIGESIFLTFTPSSLQPKKNVKNKVVLITGGAGGVGQQLALRLARLKAKVVVWDVNEKALDQTKELLENEGHEVHTYVVDLSDRKNVYKNADLVKSEVGHIDILINNAGIVCGNTFLDIPDDMIEKTFQVNIMSHYWTTKAFLGDMLRRGKGHIVTMGSLTGLLGTYKCTDYSATKYAAIGFHESLFTELRTHGHDNIHLTLVCPYFINTGMFAGAKPRNFPMLEPKDVAKRMILAIRTEEVYCTMPSFARYVLPIKNYLPSKLCWALMYRVIQGPQSMMGLRNFSERQSEVAAA